MRAAPRPPGCSAAHTCAMRRCATLHRHLGQPGRLCIWCARYGADFRRSVEHIRALLQCGCRLCRSRWKAGQSSEREQRCAVRAVAHTTTKAARQTLGLSPETVKHHLKKTSPSWACNSRTEALEAPCTPDRFVTTTAGHPPSPGWKPDPPRLPFRVSGPGLSITGARQARGLATNHEKTDSARHGSGAGPVYFSSGSGAGPVARGGSSDGSKRSERLQDCTHPGDVFTGPGHFGLRHPQHVGLRGQVPNMTSIGRHLPQQLRASSATRAGHQRRSADSVIVDGVRKWIRSSSTLQLFDLERSRFSRVRRDLSRAATPLRRSDHQHAQSGPASFPAYADVTAGKRRVRQLRLPASSAARQRKVLFRISGPIYLHSGGRDRETAYLARQVPTSCTTTTRHASPA